MPDDTTTNEKQKKAPITRYVRMLYNQYSKKAIMNGENTMSLQDFATQQQKKEK